MPWLKDMLRDEFESRLSQGLNTGISRLGNAFSEGISDLVNTDRDTNAVPQTPTAAANTKPAFNFDLTSYNAVVDFMAFHMESDAHGENAKWLKIYNGIPVAGDIRAAEKFANLVLGAWDYKSAIRNCIQLFVATIPSKGSTFWGTPIPNDKEFLYFYDIWTNIHYGYVGRHCGFPEWELRTGSEVHDMVKSHLSERESMDDSVSVEAGFRLFELGSANAVTLQSVIEDAARSWTEGITKFRPQNLGVIKDNSWSENSFKKLQPITSGE